MLLPDMDIAIFLAAVSCSINGFLAVGHRTGEWPLLVVHFCHMLFEVGGARHFYGKNVMSAGLQVTWSSLVSHPWMGHECFFSVDCLRGGRSGFGDLRRVRSDDAAGPMEGTAEVSVATETCWGAACIPRS